jgi:hypothetical protein
MKSLRERFRSWSVGDWSAVVMALAAVVTLSLTLGDGCSPPPPPPTATLPPTATVPPTEEPSAVRIRTIEYAPAAKPDCDWEYVELVNEGDESADISYWTVEDLGARHKFTFPEWELAPGTTVKVWTTSANSAPGDLSWDRTDSVWNNDGDLATLRDRDGNEIHQLACGQ